MIKKIIWIIIIVGLFYFSSQAQILSSGQLDNPYKIAISNGCIYSVDTANNRIKKFDAAGNLLLTYGSFGSGNDQFNQPQGIAVDSKGYVYVVDTGNQRIQKFFDNKNNCEFVESITNIPELKENQNFSFPRSIRVNDLGEIFIVDTANNRIIKYKTAMVIGGQKQELSAQSVQDTSNFINAPYGAGIDEKGIIYIADTENHKIKKYDASGNLLLEIGGKGQGNGEFLFPFDATVDQSGNIYVADTGNNRIQKFDVYGKYIGLIADNVLAPRGLFVSREGYLYAIGADNNIRRFDIAVRLNNFYVLNSSFSPNGDKIKDDVQISFDLSEQALIDIEILSENQKIICKKLFEKKEFASPNIRLVWDGLDENGKIIDGTYWIKVSGVSKDGQKNIMPVLQKIILDTTVPIINTKNISNAIFSPVLNQEIIWSFNCSDNFTNTLLRFSADIFKKDVLIENISRLKELATDEVTVTWNGKMNNNYVKDGQYEFVIKVEDEAGNKSQLVSLFEIDSSPPEDFLILNPKYDDYIGEHQISFKWEQAKDSHLQGYQLILSTSSEINVEKDYIYSATFEALTTFYNYNQKLEGKEYSLFITAFDVVGNKKTALTKFRIDNQPPRIENLTLSQKYFNPDFKKPLLISFVVNDDATIILRNLKINLDANVLFEKFEIDNGLQEIYCTFEVEGLADGEYPIKISVEDKIGNQGTSEVIIVLDRIPPEIKKASLSKTYLTPNNDGIDDSTDIVFSVSENCKAQIRIFSNKTSQEVFAYNFSEVLPDQLYKVTWDGKINTVHVPQPGDYRVEITLIDLAGNVSSLMPGVLESLIVDTSSSLVPYLYANPDPFSAFNTPTKIKYSLSRDNLTVNLKVLGEDNQTVKILVSKEKQNKGAHEIIWTGDCDPSYKGPRHSQDPNKITDGTYEFVIEVEDKEGVKPAIISNTIRVDSTAPYLLLKPVQIDYVNKKIKFDYTVPEKSSVEIKAYKEDNSLIQDFGIQEKEPGTYVFAWEPGILASNPCYVHIIATDKAQNKAEAKTEIFSTVPQNIFKLSGFTALPSTFTPNGDGYLDQAKISYKIEGGVEPYKVSVNILSASNATLKKIIDSEEQHSESQSFYWTGTLDTSIPGSLGTFVSDGEYYCEIKAEDALGKKLEEKVKIIAVSTKPEIKISIDPAAFSPNADGSQDVMKVNYSVNYSNYISLSSFAGEGRESNSQQLATGQGEAKFEVYDKDNQIILTKYFNHTPGNYSFTLDPPSTPLGASSISGNLGTFSDGEYVLRAFIEDALGSPGIVESLSFKIDNVKPSLSILSFSPREFSPNGDSRKDNLFISYSLSKKSQITVQVLDSQDQLVHTLIDHAWTEKYEPMSSLSSFTGEGRKAISKQLSKQQGEVRTLTVPGISWDGSTPRPMGEGPGVRVVPDGAYKLRIFATDEAGNSSYLEENVLIDTQFPIAPQISNLPGHTNIQAQFIQGTGEAQALAYLYNNEILIAEKTVEANGSFSFPVNLLAGDNSFKVKVEDAAGNISAYSNVVNAFYETTAPQIISFEVTPKIAKAGNVLITFEASEPLVKNPTVKVNSNSALLQSSNENQYTYIYAVSSSDKQGTADISIELEDLAGNLELVRRSYLGEGGTFSIDTQNIVISEVDISPYYASAESEVIVNFSVNEKLFKLPELSINNNKLSFSSSQEISNTKYQYEYKYKIQPSDIDNVQTLLKISVEDLAHNITLESYAFVIDKTAPQVLDLRVEKDPAKAGDMKISFKVSESLNQAPIVKVKQNGDIVKVLPVAYDSQLTAYSLPLSAIYNVVSGFDGTAQITVEVIDKALNANTQEKTFVVDTIKPEFTDIKCEIEMNQDFSRYAKLNSKVKITFKSSEPLKFNPDVEINGNLASYLSFDNLSNIYTYEYTITSQDKAGVAQVKISGTDLADNFGENIFDVEKDTFVIDLVSPIVEIENNSALIANPSRFSTNANPLGSEPKSTTLQYKISEYGKVTLNIHKVPNDKTTYARSDFDSNNKVAVLVNGVWLDKGAHSISYDGKMVGVGPQYIAAFDTNQDGYADPGKYAFIVEVKDRAGNVTERLWGGTFWIQDNVLKVEEPDQTVTGGMNPNPKYFSPKGLGNKSKFHFKILLGITPKQYKEPERIEVLGIQDDIAWITGEAKKAGTYTVRIYDESNNLVRTIVENQEFYTATNLYEEWDGFSLVPGSLGPLIPVSDGRYFFEIEVKDYSGNPALVNNKMRKEVYVDNTVPEIINPYAGGINEWKNASGTNEAYNVDFKDFGSKLVKAEYKIEKQTDWREIFNVSANPLDKYEADWKIDFNACKEGANNISIRVYDQAGNNTSSEAFYVKKDTGVPVIDDNQTGDDSWRTSNNGAYNIDFSDTTSDISYFQVKICKNDKQQNQIIDWTIVKDKVGKLSYTDNWSIPDSIWNLMPEGTSYVSIRVFDSANNSAETIDVFYVKKDTGDPEIIDNQTGDDNWKSSSGEVYDVDFKDSISGLVSAQYRITSVPNQGGQELKAWTNIFNLALPANNYTQNWGVDFDVCPEGTSYVSVRTYDQSGRSTIKNDVFYIKRDLTPPSINISTPAQTFNPYSNNSNINCEFIVTDTGSGIKSITAEVRSFDPPIYYYPGSWKHIKNLIVTSLGNNRYSIGWEGMNNSGDYVDEGNYSFFVYAIDNATLSTAEGTAKDYIKLRDDVRITNTSGDSNSPYLNINGNTLDLKWVEGYQEIQTSVSTTAVAGSNNDFNGSIEFNLDFGQEVSFEFGKTSSLGGGASWFIDGKGPKQDTDYKEFLSAGKHILKVEASPPFFLYPPIVANVKASYLYRKYSQYSSSTSDLGKNWGSISGPVVVDNFPNPQQTKEQIIKNGNVWHKIYAVTERRSYPMGGHNYFVQILYYSRSNDAGNTWSNAVRINQLTNSCFNGIDWFTFPGSGPNGGTSGNIYPTVVCDTNNNAYVAWTDSRDRNNEIYFQKIPSNFAPLKGTSTYIYPYSVNERIEQLAVNTSLEAISPINGETIKTIRPTFKWYGLTGVQKYKIECTKPGLSQRDLTKIFSSNEVSSSKPALFYTIHEFDEGLQKSNNDLDFWNWKIKAYDASDVVTAESTSNNFLIIPDLTLEEVINYPNPFNPKREITKIRYRLSRQAEWVKIRIYDLVGSLVREIDGTTNAEGVGIWQKYNDVTWDGLNGRGDMVLNGVYPFEVIAKLGDRTVSGRGKIAVLK